MGGALGRPAQVTNAVAGREGAYALSVIAPSPPPLVGIAPAVASATIDALSPWATGTSLVNFAGGHPDGLAKSWPADVLQRLRHVKAAVDPANVFGGPLGAREPEPAGAR